MLWPEIFSDDSTWLHADISSSLEYKPLELLHFSLTCPICSSCQDVSRRRLWRGQSWTCLRCRQCGQLSSSSRWQCACGTRWSACARHRQQGFACGGKQCKDKASLSIVHNLSNMRLCRRLAPPRTSIRRLHALKPPPPKHPWFEVEVPLTANNLSWLQRRPLKPGSVAWLVAMRQANSGQRQLAMQAEPAVGHDMSRDATMAQ